MLKLLLASSRGVVATKKGKSLMGIRFLPDHLDPEDCVTSKPVRHCELCAYVEREDVF